MGSSPFSFTNNNKMSHIPGNVWSRTVPFDSGNTSSINEVILRSMEAKMNVLILKELELITVEEMRTLIKMIMSPDTENITVAEQIIK